MEKQTYKVELLIIGLMILFLIPFSTRAEVDFAKELDVDAEEMIKIKPSEVGIKTDKEFEE